MSARATVARLRRVPTTHYRALVAKADGFFARVHLRHAAEMDCAEGCHDCCVSGLALTAVEAADVRAHLATLPDDARAALRATRGRLDGCPALDPRGRCGIYAARPLVCRTHGVPVRIDGVVSACPRNFRAGLPGGDAVLEQATLSTMLAAVDAAYVAGEAAPGGRVPLADLLAE